MLEEEEVIKISLRFTIQQRYTKWQWRINTSFSCILQKQPENFLWRKVGLWMDRDDISTWRCSFTLSWVFIFQSYFFCIGICRYKVLNISHKKIINKISHFIFKTFYSEPVTVNPQKVVRLSFPTLVFLVRLSFWGAL